MTAANVRRPPPSVAVFSDVIVAEPSNRRFFARTGSRERRDPYRRISAAAARGHYAPDASTGATAGLAVEDQRDRSRAKTTGPVPGSDRARVHPAGIRDRTLGSAQVAQKLLDGD